MYEIETFVVNNLDAIQSATINTCDILTEYIGSKLVSCDSTTIIIQDTKNEVSIRYEITINDAMKITKFKTNSTHMQERIREEITDLNTNSSTLIPTIVAITNVSWESAQSDSLEHQVGIADKFIVIDRIKRYM
ncbi:MAG: hypothetical protein H6766_01930 [Candidatus Peribacteria bacterium]|nr:MAG: hypothetical protein H6766_01930 [Candidatus Peribacteria bacterium]